MYFESGRKFSFLSFKLFCLLLPKSLISCKMASRNNFNLSYFFNTVNSELFWFSFFFLPRKKRKKSIKEKYSNNKFIYFLYVHFFSFELRKQKKRNEPKKRKTGAVNRNSYVFYQRFCHDKLWSKSSQNTTVSNKIPSGLRPEPPTAYKVSR